MEPGYYNVLEIRDMREEASNGHLWYRVGENLWCADVNGVDYLPAKEKPGKIYDMSIHYLNETDKSYFEKIANERKLKYETTLVG